MFAGLQSVLSKPMCLKGDCWAIEVEFRCLVSVNEYLIGAVIPRMNHSYCKIALDFLIEFELGFDPGTLGVGLKPELLTVSCTADLLDFDYVIS